MAVMSAKAVQFNEALYAEIVKVEAVSGKDAWRVGGIFTDIIKNVINSIGLGDLTLEEFLELVSTAYDAFTLALGIPPVLNSLLKSMVLTIATRIYNKRVVPKPVVNPQA